MIAMQAVQGSPSPSAPIRRADARDRGRVTLRRLVAFVFASIGAASVLAAPSAEDLAKLAQKPIANVVAPDDGADWQIRAQVQLTFPQ